MEALLEAGRAEGAEGTLSKKNDYGDVAQHSGMQGGRATSFMWPNQRLNVVQSVKGTRTILSEHSRTAYG